ncbi:MAG: glycosyl transferase group 1, partial [Armatimonadetes bacterium]|nr:glycosyl transferase group 1 [Armatimonadota bacterium]
MRLGLAMEYSLGHVTHADNLKAVLARDRSVRPSYIDLPYHRTPGWWAGLPGVRSNWSLRASLGAYLGLRRRTASLDGALFHTQVTSLLSANIMRRVPSVISLDATPL